jgi:hypothetical protein
MLGFWEPLGQMIRKLLAQKSLFFSRRETLLTPDRLRFLGSTFQHGSEPLLLPNVCGTWDYLSSKYDMAYTSVLRLLGVTTLTTGEALELVEIDLSDDSSVIQSRPLGNLWHDSFLKFINTSRVNWMHKLIMLPIIPVRVNDVLQWQRPGQAIYFPNIVDEGTGSDRVKIDMPQQIELSTLWPDAAINSNRLKIYGSLGVQNCPVETLCRAVEKQHIRPGSHYTLDLRTCLEILYWFSYKLSFGAQPKLIASTSANIYAQTRTLFMRSIQPYDAETLLALEDHPEFKNKFLNPIYQKSPISTRSRGGTTWEAWLRDVAGVRYHPPLADLDNRNKLHWIIETVKKESPGNFVPLIQHYWSQEYNHDSRLNNSLRQELMQSQVLCMHGGYESLSKTWFPTKSIVSLARYYGVDQHLPVLALPGVGDGLLASDWPSLTVLGCRSADGFDLFKEILLIMAEHHTHEPRFDMAQVTSLYQRLGETATLTDTQTLKVCPKSLLGSELIISVSV